MPNLHLAEDIVEERQSLEKAFGKMFDDEFAGLAPGTRYLHDPEFYSWFETERNGIPLGPDPMTGQAMWKKEPRPNFEQMLALAGSEGHEILRRYGRITGREEQTAAFIKLVEAAAKVAREAKNG